MNVPSQDISEFIILTTFDLTGTTPQICLEAASVGVNEAQVEYIFKITAPSGAVIHEGDFTAPDSTGNADPFCVDIPLFNESIEWSGGDYVIVATMRDTALLEFSQTILATICPPRGNSVAGKWYGQSSVSVEVKCENAEVLLHDTTNYDYKGKTKTLISKTLTLVFPADPETGIQPAPVVVTNFNDAVIPITYNGNYIVMLVSLYSYDLGDGVTLEVKYTTYNKKTGIHKAFVTECYIDLCPLLCEFAEFVETTEELCGVNDVQYQKNKDLLSIINAKMALVFANKSCGKPVGTLIAEIISISGFQCNCDCDNNGIVKRDLISVPGSGTLVFAAVTSCGDVAGVFTNPTPGNYLLTLSDKTYAFAITPAVTTIGFTLTATTVGCVKTYSLDVDLDTFATELLVFIDNDATLKAAFCALVAQCDPADPFNGVNMLCVSPTLNNACDYFGQLLSGQAHHAYDRFYGIEVNGVIYSPPTNLIYTNATQINAWLQTLGFGFGATDYVNAAGTVSFTTLANINSVTKLIFFDVVLSQIYSVWVTATNCSGVTGTDKMQALFTFLCNLNTAVYGIDYMVKSDSTSTTPYYLFDILYSSDSSVTFSVIAEKVNVQALLKTNAADACGGYLIDKIDSDTLVVTNQPVTITAYDYVVTSTQYGAAYNLYTIKIEGVVYPIAVVSTNLSGINSALNALGLGTFAATSPAANLVITSLGNRYVVENIVMENTVGPVYTTFNAVQSNPQSLGSCAKVFIDTKSRTWTDITIDAAAFNVGTSVAEYASLDSLNNVMMNLSLDTDPMPIAGTISVNPADLLPVDVRPRSTQRIFIWSGWDTTDNIGNYIIINTSGLIELEYNLPTTSPNNRMDSIYYPTN